MRGRTAAFVVAAVATATVVARGQSGNQTRSVSLVPPKAVVDIVDAAPLATVEVGPAGDVLAVFPRRGQPTIAEMAQTVPERDRIVALKPPFKDDATDVAKTEFRFGGVEWTDKGTILLTENDRKTPTTRTWLLNADWTSPRKLWDRKQQDAHANPGTSMYRPGRNTVLQIGDVIYLNGLGASAQGDRPFVDKLNLETLAVERVFRSDERSYESAVALLDDHASRLLTRRESRTEPPNYFVRDLNRKTHQPATAFKDPHPQITSATSSRMFVTYRRSS